MLRYDEKERIPANQAIKHLFLVLKNPINNKTFVLDDLFLNKIKPFLEKNKFLKLLAFQYSARWRDSSCLPLKEALQEIDVDQDGIISKEEYLAGRLFSSSN